MNKDNSKSKLYIPEYYCLLGCTAVWWSGIHLPVFWRNILHLQR